MSSHIEFIDYILEQIIACGAVRYRKMFGDYMVYVDDKPIILVCDDVPYVKICPETTAIIENADTGYPYDGAKLHYILDIDNRLLSMDVVNALLPITPISIKKSRSKAKLSK